MDGQSEPPEVLQLRISLDGISSEIWRRVLVLSSSTIYDLHHTIQIVMGWEDYHLNQFQIHGKSYGVYHNCVFRSNVPAGAKRRWWSDFYSKGSFCVNDERFFLIDSPFRFILCAL